MIYQLLTFIWDALLIRLMVQIRLLYLEIDLQNYQQEQQSFSFINEAQQKSNSKEQAGDQKYQQESLIIENFDLRKSNIRIDNSNNYPLDQQNGKDHLKLNQEKEFHSKINQNQTPLADFLKKSQLSIQDQQQQFIIKQQIVKDLQKKQLKFNNEYKIQERQKQKFIHNQAEIKQKIDIQVNRIQMKVSIQSFLNKKFQKKQSKIKTENQQQSQTINNVKQYFQKVQNIWQELDEINHKDPSGQLTQMIYKEILNQKPTKAQFKEHQIVSKAIQMQSQLNNDSIQTAMLCLANHLRNLSDQIDVTFCQKSTLQSKVSAKVLSTGFDSFKYKCVETIKDEQSQWTFQNISANPKQLQRFEKWYIQRLKKQYGIDDKQIKIRAIQKGSIRVEWETSNPQQIAANPTAATRIKVHPYFCHYSLSPEDFDQRGNIQFGGYKNDVQFRGQWPYYQPINCKRYGIKVWGLYDNGNNAWLTMSNSPGQWTVAYHGVNSPNSQSTGSIKVLNSIMNGRNSGTMLRAGPNNAYRSNMSMNKNQLIGDGIYCSPHIYEALSYTQPVRVNGKQYHLIFQCRVNPKKVHITPHEQYWVLNNPQDIRPYGIILMKTQIRNVYPSQNSQFGQTFSYRKYQNGIDKTQF